MLCCDSKDELRNYIFKLNYYISRKILVCILFYYKVFDLLDVGMVKILKVEKELGETNELPF